MRQLVRNLTVLASLITLAACSNARTHQARNSPAMSTVGAYGALAAGDTVGRAAFDTTASGSDRMVSVPISMND